MNDLPGSPPAATPATTPAGSPGPRPGISPAIAPLAGGQATGTRRLLRRMRDVMAAAGAAQGRLDRIVVLVAAGGVYLVTQGSDNADGKGGGGKTASGAVKPGEIEVTVLNGTAVPGLAAEFGDKVERKGFQLGAVTNSATSFTDSVVMFKRGNAPEARRVAAAVGISQVRLMTPDIAEVSGGAPVSVIVGEDNASTSG